MLIRAARPEDARAIASFIAMAEGELLHHFIGNAATDDVVEALTAFILSPTPNRYSLGNNIIAEEDGCAAAACIAFPADLQPELDRPIIEALQKQGRDVAALFFEGEPGTYYLSTMGVDPDFRGQGLGTALLTAGLDRGHALGFARASLLVSKDKVQVKELYSRLGFEAVSTVEIAGHAYYRMTKKL